MYKNDYLYIIKYIEFIICSKMDLSSYVDQKFVPLYSLTYDRNYMEDAYYYLQNNTVKMSIFLSRLDINVDSVGIYYFLKDNNVLEDNSQLELTSLHFLVDAYEDRI